MMLSVYYPNIHRVREIATDDQLKQIESHFPRKYFPDLDDPTKDPLRDHCDVIIEKLGELIGMIRCPKCITSKINELNKVHVTLGISEECRRVSVSYCKLSSMILCMSSCSFQLIINGMVLTIKTILGNDYKKDVGLSWEAFLEYIFQPQEME